jgi:NADH dehydrogenase FAD-containing subunit
LTGRVGGRAVLLGAGHAHLHVLERAAAFAARGHELVAVAPDRFWYSGLATGVLGGEYPPELDQVDVSALAARGGGRFVRGRAVRVDPAARLVHLEDGPPLAYDALSLNLGSEAPAIPGDAAPNVYAAKPVRRVWELRAELERRFRDAPRDAVRVALAGGGVTAFELAANVSALAARRGGRVEVTVLAAGTEVLQQLPPAAARRVVGALRGRGVALRTGARVARIEDGRRAALDGGGSVPFDLFVNATGLRPNRLVRDCGLPVDGAGALRVDAHLRSVADAAVHGGGDGVAFEGRDLPRVGVYAIRQAPVLRRNLLALLEGTAPRRFTPQRRHLWIMNLGDGTGLAARGALWWHGRAAHWLKDRIDRRFVRGYQRAAGS